MCSPTMRPNHALQRTRRKRRAAERTGYAERCTSRFSRWVLLNGALFSNQRRRPVEISLATTRESCRTQAAQNAPQRAAVDMQCA